MTEAEHPLPGYDHDQDYLNDVLQLITLQLEYAVARFRAVRGDQHQEGFMGLFLDDADINRLLRELGSGKAASYGGTTDDIMALRQRIVARAGATASRLPPQRLAEALGLGQMESDLILYLLAGEVDPRFARVWAFLQDDVQRRYMTPGLALQLFPHAGQSDLNARIRRLFAADAPLRRQSIVTMMEPSRPLLDRPLKLDDRIVDFLLGNDCLDAELVTDVELLRHPQPRLHTTAPPPLAAVPRHFTGNQPLPPVLLRDESGEEWDLWLARKRGADLLRLRPEAGNGDDEEAWRHLLRRVRREQQLREALVSAGSEAPLSRDQLAALYQILPDNLIITDPRGYQPGTSCSPPLEIHLQTPDDDQRATHWQHHLPAQWLNRQPADMPRQLARRYRFSSPQIREVSRRLESRLALDGQADATTLRQLCKETAAQPMQGGAQRVDCQQDWEQLVLPAANKAMLQELTLRASHQQQVLSDWGLSRLFSQPPGLSALFVGPSGTGKTLAASVVARTLGLELYRVDLATVVSKYIGETEKNLQNIFHHAAQAEVVLFFDEADALFGKRSEVKDAHDRYANIETSYLLQQIEDHAGLCILASNLAQNIDEAFMRRIQVVVEFPLPGVEERHRIWQQLLTTEAPVTTDLELDFLARQFELTGGHIKNTLLLAGCYAAEEDRAINMGHLVRAIAREYGKLGRPVTKNLFGDYYQRLKKVD
ncbi:ATP-binding protein [Marinobacter lacisalsi]|uniref:ATP-binding protein n=1 Tax=Marinobacter lacisalsi TaxID=475979 RepID=A0ABV8QKW9_9GAMM